MASGARLCPYILDLISRHNRVKYYYKEALGHGAAAIGFIACSGGKITFELFSKTPVGIWRTSSLKIVGCQEQTLCDAEESVIASVDLSGTTRTFQENATRGSPFAAHSASNVSKLSVESACAAAKSNLQSH